MARSRCLAVGAMKPDVGSAGEGAIFVGLVGLGVFDGGQVAMSWANFSVTVGAPQHGSPLSLSLWFSVLYVY